MVLRLSELLERIRPAGTPGAPTEGEVQRREDRRATEIETITAILTSFEADADEIVATALLEADRIRTKGHGRANEAAAAVSDRMAVAESEAAHVLEQRDQAETERIQRTTDLTISRLQARAEDQTPRLVKEIIEVIWSQLLPPNAPSGRRP